MNEGKALDVNPERPPSHARITLGYLFKTLCWDNFAPSTVLPILSTSEAVLKYRMWNNLCPYSIYPLYSAYEQILKRSSRLRKRWENQHGMKANFFLTRESPKAYAIFSTPKQRLTYDDLQPGAIRLLHLQCSGDDPLVCSLVVHDLKNIPDYLAISYSWVGNNELMSIPCGSEELQIQRSLYQLFNRVKRELGSVFLWIDAVCINQADKREQSSQVAMMDLIYSSASKVLVWLGEEDQHIDPAANLLKIIQGHAQDELELPSHLDQVWSHLNRLLDRPWFTRAWVLQEVLLSHECLAWCGDYSWNWEYLMQMLEIVMDREGPDSSGAGYRIKQSVAGISRTYRERSPATRRRLMELLVSTRGLQASWKVDKVYSVLPLCEDSLGIQVDYAKNVQQLYEDVAAALIGKGHLEILKYAGDCVWNNVNRLASWVPDWSSRDRPAVLPHGKWATKYPVPIAVKGQSLTMQVVILQHVQRTGVPWPSLPYYHPDAVGGIWGLEPRSYMRLESWRSMLWPLEKYEPTDEPVRAAFLKTIVANSVSVPPKYMTWSGPNARTPCIMRERDALHEKDRWIHAQDVAKIEELKYWSDAIKIYCYKRTFFLTRNGFMGLGPFFTLPGDRIIAIPGLHGRFLVRRTLKGRYRLVGECYVHGMGKNDEIELSKLPRQNITIV